MQILKTIFFKYQVAMYYIAQTAGEYGKLAGFVNNILLGATFLATVFGVHLNLKQLIVLWFGLMVSCYFIGRFLVKIGVTKFNAKLGNQQNEEIMEILEWVREQKKK